jgi:O-antigen ligase
MWVLCVISFYLVAHGGTRADWISALFWPVALLGIYVAVFQFAGVIEPWRIVRAGFMPAYAAIMAAARLFMGKDKGGVKFLVFVVFAANMIAVFDARSWVSGWLTAAIGVMVVILFCSRKAFFAVAAVGLLGLLLYPSFIDNVYDVSRHEGDMDRFTIWADSARMAGLNNPVLGIGPGDYLTYSRKYASVWYGNTTYTNAHSSYAQAVAELGIFGIAALIWLAVAGVKTGISATRRSRADLKWFAAGATGVFASIAVTSVVGDYLLPSRVNGAVWTFGTSAYPWILLGGAVALARISGSERVVEEEPCEELLRQI